MKDAKDVKDLKLAKVKVAKPVDVKAEHEKFKAALERIAALEDIDPATVYANSDPRAIAKEALGVEEADDEVGLG